MKFIFSVVLVGCASLGFVRPATALDPARSIGQYKHTRWLVDDGAPHEIRVLAQGSSGYLWIGCVDGLFRFDGITFEPIKARAGSETRSVSAITVLPNGDVWIGYAVGGTSVYRDGSLQDVATPERYFVMDIVQLPDSTLGATLGQNFKQLMQYKDGRWHDWASEIGFPGEQPVKMIVARDGTLWVTTQRSVLVLRKGAKRLERLNVTPNGNASVADDGRGHVWLSDQSGTRTVSPEARSGHAPVSYPTPFENEKSRR